MSCSVIKIAPYPLIASVIKKGLVLSIANDVGWNCMNSISLMSAPARSAIPTPSPVAIDGLVVDRCK